MSGSTAPTAILLPEGRPSDEPSGFTSFRRTVGAKTIMGLYMQFSTIALVGLLALLRELNRVPLNAWSFVAAICTLTLVGMALVVAVRSFRWAREYKSAFAWFFNGPLGGALVAAVVVLLFTQGDSVSFGSGTAVPLFVQKVLMASCYVLLFSALLFTSRMPSWLATEKIKAARQTTPTANLTAVPGPEVQPHADGATA